MPAIAPPDHADLKKQFAQRFGEGGKLLVVRAPGRVNLIGEHTDYNDGFVCPMAIEPQVTVVCRGRDDGKVRLASTYAPTETVTFSVAKKITRGKPAWGNYMRGVAAELIAAGIPVTGMDALYTNNLPVGGGLSSSAAIEVATGVCLLALARAKMDPMRLAEACQRAENKYARVPCGIMDQMIVAGAHAGKATLFDCRSKEKKYVAIDPEKLRVVICNSKVKHQLTDGEYKKRRQQCEAGVKFFRKTSPDVIALRDVSLQQLDAAEGKLNDLIFRRCRHVVTENARCQAAAKAFKRGDYALVGKLMVESHDSLRDDYEVSVPELDFLVEQAMKVPGVYGARMTGGGFGGCIVALCEPTAVAPLTRKLNRTYPAKYKKTPDIFATTATAGAGLSAD